jgi:hypothetical protein
LRLCRELVVAAVCFEGLLGLAAVAAVGDDLERAGRLSGASAAHRYGQPTGPVEERLHAAYLEPARTRLGAGAWEAAVRDGAALSFGEAIADALA